MEFNGREVFNLSRTAQLSEVMGISAVQVMPERVAWIQAALGGVNYQDVTTAPWYDAGFPASSEFAGIIPLSVAGLDDSTLTSEPTEYITDGGNPGRARSGTLTIVSNVVLVATTDRGAEYGKRWLARTLADTGRRAAHVGAVMRYFQYEGAGAPIVHRRNVKMTRGLSITRKRSADCNVTWMVTYTMNSGDPFEYGAPVKRVASLGAAQAAAPAGAPPLQAQGNLSLVQSPCPSFDYTPVYDPAHPALVPAPQAPSILPLGWNIETGMAFKRYWARVDPVEPSGLLSVPVITLTATQEARRVRVQVWPSDSLNDDQCDPLFSATVAYLPPNVDFVIDGEAKSAYTWDRFSPGVRRSDSLVYGPNARPLQWAAFSDHSALLVTLDIFTVSGADEGGGTVRAALNLVPKSD